MRLHYLLIVVTLLLFGGLLSGCGASENNVATPTTAVSAPTPAALEITADENAAETAATAVVTSTTTITEAVPATDTEPITETAASTATTSTTDSTTISVTEASTATAESVTLVATEEPVLIPTDTPGEQDPAQNTDSETENEGESDPESTAAAETETETQSAGGEDAAPGTVLNVQFVERVSAADIDQNSQFFYPADNLIEARYAVDIYRLEVQSTTETGEPIDLQTDVYVPRVEEPTAFPMFAYAPGTTGLGDGCAPSQEVVLGRGWGSYYTHMLSYAGQGYIGVIPDGMSYDDPQRPHEYFIAELEAHTLLDAVRGAQNFVTAPEWEIPAQPLDAIFFGGYSNGGHTAFAAKDFAAEYAPELPIRGVISHGATTNVETLMRESPIFTPYLIYAYQFYYGGEVITPQQVFTQNWLPTFVQDVATKCVDEIFVYYSNDPVAMYNDAFLNALNNNELADRFPLFKTVLDANYAGTFGGFEIPAVFFQGTADATVTPRAQQQFAQDLCAQEQPVTYVSLPTVRHVDTRQRSFLATLEWMQTIVEGEMPENNCGELIEE